VCLCNLVCVGVSTPWGEREVSMGGQGAIELSSCREEVLESMPPFMGGGEMIENVGLTESTYAPPPSRFEPGTPGIAEGIGFGSAIDYLSAIGMDKVYSFEQEIGGLLYQEVRLSGCKHFCCQHSQ